MPDSGALIAQLIMPRLNVDSFEAEPEYRARIEGWVREEKAGGFCFFGGTPERVARTILRLQQLASAPLLCSSDSEYGLPMRLTGGGTEFPDAMAIAKTGEPDLAFSAGAAIAKEMRAIGLNWNFAPVTDVNSNPHNPIINTRAFGDDPKTVATYATAFMRGLQSERVAATAKHFPGHGDTSIDSHRELPVLDRSGQEFDDTELPPFRTLIRTGVDSIMTGHLAAPRLAHHLGSPASEEKYPATLSPALTTTLLRKQLGFEGVIVTDALEMHAITKHFGPEEAAVLALRAGADVLLMPLDAGATHAAIAAAIAHGALSLEDIQQHVARVQRLRNYCSIDPSTISAERLGECSAEHAALAQTIAEKAVELTGIIDVGEATFLILTDDRPEAALKARLFADLLPVAVAKPTIISTNKWSDASVEFESNAIIVTIHRARGYVGALETAVTLPAIIREIADSLAGRGLAPRGLVLLGSPYLDREFQTPPQFVLKTFSESPVSLKAAVNALHSR
ncbi:MAG: glycoside hydrolase family 3 protein [Acidobacteriaceae bacterium]